MKIPKLELHIKPFTADGVEHKLIDNLVLSWRQDHFVVLYNHYFTPLVNGDHLRLGDHLITVSLSMEKNQEKSKQSFRLGSDHPLSKPHDSPNDILAFLFQKEQSSLPPSILNHLSSETELPQQQPLENHEASQDNFQAKQKKPGIWFKNRLIWRKKS